VYLSGKTTDVWSHAKVLKEFNVNLYSHWLSKV
jgi:hypothetical protein